MAKDRISIPFSGGGLMRYSDEFKSKLQLKPAHVIILIVLVLIFEILLHTLY